MLALQALLRDRLLEGYRTAAGRGWADLEEKSNFENLYRQYHQLGLNGVMDDVRSRFLPLPIRPGPAAYGRDRTEGR